MGLKGEINERSSRDVNIKSSSEIAEEKIKQFDEAQAKEANKVRLDTQLAERARQDRINSQQAEKDRIEQVLK